MSDSPHRQQACYRPRPSHIRRVGPFLFPVTSLSSAPSIRFGGFGLTGNDLKGKLPPEWGNLASLVSLDLYGNHLAGELPPEWGSLANLERLDLGGTQLGGCLPFELVDTLGDAITGLELLICVPQVPPPPAPSGNEDS